MNAPTSRAAKAKTITPRIEALVMARRVQGGTFMVVSIPNTSDKNRIRVARRILKTLRNQPFHTMIFNTSNVSATLPKNMKLVQLTETPLTIVPVREVSEVDSVKVIPIYKGRQNRE